MRILLASARLDDLQWAWGNGLADGLLVTSNALTTEASDGDFLSHLGSLCRASTLPVSAPVWSVTSDDIHRDGRELARISDRITVQVPLVEEALVAMRRLSAEGIRVAASFVFSPAQALLAAKAGATAVHVPIDQLDHHGLDGVAVVDQISRVFEIHGAECDVVASLPRNAAHFSAAVSAQGKEVARCTGLVQRAVPLPLPESLPGHPLPKAPKPPEECLPGRFPFHSDERVGYSQLVETRVAAGHMFRGPCAIWFRLRHPVVEGETPSGEGDVVYSPRGCWHGFNNTSNDDVVLVWGWMGAGSIADSGYEVDPKSHS